MKVRYTGLTGLDLTNDNIYDVVSLTTVGVIVQDDIGDHNTLSRGEYIVVETGGPRLCPDRAKAFEPEEDERGLGLKFDAGKPQARLVDEGFPFVFSGLADVLTFGANKYEANSWQHVENGIARYSDAAKRHQLKRLKGEELDPESGLDHELHELINRMFVLELKLRAKADGTNQ